MSNLLTEKFEISDINKEEVILKLTSLEFEDTFINVKYKGNSSINLGDDSSSGSVQ